jgi:Response regulator containing CheY-like receiver, AAA-type ATPase, and DNA-binding domains
VTGITSRSPLSPHEVLVIDDEYAFRWAVVRLCQKRGMEADVAENGREAIELLDRRRGTYCCIVLDLTMPRFDGRAVLDRIQPTSAWAPSVIVVTAFPELASSLNASENASLVKKVFLKPVDPAEIVAMVEQCQGHSQPRAS